MKCWCEEIRNKQGNENYFCIDCQPKEEPKGELKEKLMLFKAMCLKPNITEKQKYERSKMFFELIQMDNTPDNPFDSFDQTCASPYDDPFFSEIADDYLKLIEARSEEPKLWELTEKKADLEIIIQQRKKFNENIGNEYQIDDPILIRAINNLFETEQQIKQITQNFLWQRELMKNKAVELDLNPEVLKNHAPI